MATRNRVIYQSEGLFVSEEATSLLAANHVQLSRVQSANYSYTINRQDVNQYGELARIGSLVLEPPTVSVDFSYYLTDGFNERALNFYVQTKSGKPDPVSTRAHGEVAANFASGHLAAGSGVNIYVVTSPEGEDFNAGDSYESSDKIIGIGNCYVSDYSIDLSVGSLPTATVSMEGSNVRSSVGTAIRNPAVNQSDGTSFSESDDVVLPVGSSGGLGITGGGTIALRPGDITLTLDDFESETITNLASDGAGCHIQSATIAIPLSRTPLDRLGSKFAFARTVDFPVVTTLSVSAIMNEEIAIDLAEKLEAPERDVTITMKTDDGNTGVIWDFKGALVESESWSSSIGSNKSVDLTFSAQIGGPEDITAGVFLSGSNTGVVFS